MNDLTKMLEEKDDTQIVKSLVNLNKYQLNRKSHIKKYNRLRTLHGEILDSMEQYVSNGNYIIDNYFKFLNEKSEYKFNLKLYPNDPDDMSIITELQVYKNHKHIPSVTEIYLEKKKFRNAEKIKMLESMNKSHVSLFKIVEVDRNNGYVTYLDVFNGKKYKIIDIAMSSTLKIDKKKYMYIYNRIITFDDISFATGIHCYFVSENKELKKFIKNYKTNKCSNFIRCLALYDLSKKSKKISITYNHEYGYRRR